MISPQVIDFLKLLYEKRELPRKGQDIIKTKWYFDLVMFKLERANIIRIGHDSVYMTVIGRKWCKRLFIIEDGE